MLELKANLARPPCSTRIPSGIGLLISDSVKLPVVCNRYRGRRGSEQVIANRSKCGEKQVDETNQSEKGRSRD